MRIALFNWRDLAHPRAGGAEVYTEEIARRWAAAGHGVTIFSAAVAGRPDREAIDGVEHVRAGGRTGVYGAARRWWHEVGRSRDYDLMIDEVNVRPFRCHRWAGHVPVVALMHQLAREIWFYELPWPAAVAGRFVLEPRWLRSLRDVPCLTISESSRRTLLDAGLQRVKVAGIGVTGACESATPAKAPVPTVAFVGRMAANKRPAHAVEAVGLARPHLPGLELHLIGDGPERRRLAGRSPHVVAHGFVAEAEKRALIARSHALVVTSVREGWGLVVDEAARLGTPTIGYDVPGLRDSVRASGGRLVEPRPEALAEALIEDLPGLAAAPARDGWTGGADDWDATAERFLAAATTMARPVR